MFCIFVSKPLFNLLNGQKHFINNFILKVTYQIFLNCDEWLLFEKLLKSVQNDNVRLKIIHITIYRQFDFLKQKSLMLLNYRFIGFIFLFLCSH